MTFDVQGARQAGYSDSEIAAHLAQQSKFDTEGARKAGYSDSEIVEHLTGSSAREARPGPLTIEIVGSSRDYERPQAGGAQPNPQPAPAATDGMGRAAGLGARSIVKGVAGIPTLMADAASEVVNAGIGGANALGAGIDYRMQRPSAVLDRTLTDAGLPEPANATERVGSDVVSAVSGQGAFAKMADALKGAASPIMQRIAGALGSNQGTQLAAAAAGSGAAGLTREGGGGPGAQLAANIGGSLIPGAVSRAPVPQPLRDLLATSERHNVPLSYSDATGKLKKLDTTLEQVPFLGTSGFREAGAAKATNAAQNVANEARSRLTSTPWDNLKDVQAAAAGGSKKAQAVLEQVQNSGDDWTRITQASGNLNLWNRRNEAARLYDRVGELAEGRGDVPLKNTLATLDAAIAKETGSKLPDRTVIGTLEQIREGLLGRAEPLLRTTRVPFGPAEQPQQPGARAVSYAYGGQQPTTVAGGEGAPRNPYYNPGGTVTRTINPNASVPGEGAAKLAPYDPSGAVTRTINARGAAPGEGVSKPDAGNTFSAMRALRSDLGDIIDGYYKGANAAVGGKGVGSLQAVRNALDSDMQTFATSRGDDLANAWRKADAYYRNAVVPFKDRALAQALKSDTPDEIYSKFIKHGTGGGGEDRAQKFYNALDEKGRAAVRYGMIANAMEDAAISGKDQISPGRFASSLERIEKGTGVFFSGREKAELQGFTNLMRHAERFGQFTENPPTGNRAVGVLLGGGAAMGTLMDPTIAAGTAGITAAASRLLTTERGRNFLIRLTHLKAGGDEMQRLIATQLPRIAAESSGAVPVTEPKSGAATQARPIRSLSDLTR
jgi:hypothetical protein